MTSDAAAGLSYTPGHDREGRATALSVCEIDGIEFRAAARQDLENGSFGVVQVFTSQGDAPADAPARYVVKRMTDQAKEHITQQNRRGVLAIFLALAKREKIFLEQFYPAMRVYLHETKNPDDLFNHRLVMEHAGQTFYDYVSDTLMPACRLYHLLYLTVVELQRIHQAGIVHRDVKTNNVLVKIIDGRPVITFIDAAFHTRVDETLGHGLDQNTPNYSSYVAPEFVEDSRRPADPLEDVFSFCKFVEDILAMVAEHLVRFSNPLFQIPSALNDLLAAGLQTDPAQRANVLEELKNLFCYYYHMTLALEHGDRLYALALSILFQTHRELIPDDSLEAIPTLVKNRRTGREIVISAPNRPRRTRFINLHDSLHKLLLKILDLKRVVPGDEKIAFLQELYVRVLLAAQADFSPTTCRAALDVRARYQEAITRHRNDPDVRVINLGIFQIKRGRTATDRAAAAVEAKLAAILAANP